MGSACVWLCACRTQLSNPFIQMTCRCCFVLLMCNDEISSAWVTVFSKCAIAILTCGKSQSEWVENQRNADNARTHLANAVAPLASGQHCGVDSRWRYCRRHCRGHGLDVGLTGSRRCACAKTDCVQWESAAKMSLLAKPVTHVYMGERLC